MADGWALAGRAGLPQHARSARFFYFLFSFFTKIYFRVRNLHEYTPAAERQRLICKKEVDKKLRAGPWGPVARQRGGRPWPPGCGAASTPPLYKVLATPHPLICLTKNPEKKKREGGRERRGEGEAKR